MIRRDGGLTFTHDDAGEGLPFVFQHGLCGDARQTAEAFPDTPGIRRLTLDCRGHGGSDLGPVDALSIPTFADDVARLMESVCGPAVVGGISMGAAIALRLAVVRPDLVRGLVLVRPAWVTAAAPANMAPNALVGRLLSDPSTAEARFRAGATFRRLARTAPDNLASLLGFVARAPAADTAALLTAIAASGPEVTEPDLAALALPALVIGTAGDAIHPMALAARLAGLLPGARLVRVVAKGTDRPAHLAGLRQAILGFLAAQPGGPAPQAPTARPRGRRA